MLPQALLLTLLALVLAVPARGQDADALRARHAALREQLAGSAFGRPLQVQSAGAAGKQEGEIFSAIAQPYGQVVTGLGHAQAWCDILVLQTNVKRCTTLRTDGVTALAVFVTRKPRESLDDAYRADFRYDVAAAGRDYLRVVLSSPTGPLGTTDYRIVLEAAPVDERRTFVHMSYSYALGIAARVAVQGYLATSGRDKVGFSIVDRRPDGRPVYVQGVRGIVERAAMRYYLAVEAYLGALDVPPPRRLDKRLRDWRAAIERYPLQLREELSADEYLALKSRELVPALEPLRAGVRR
jgi:hypothetical protein